MELKFSNKILKIIVVVGVLVNSSVVWSKTEDVDDSPKRRVDDRAGDVKLPEDLTEGQSLLDLLKNCKSEYSYPDTFDIIPNVLGIPRVFRECLKKKLEDDHNRICEAREELERRREKARNDEIIRARIDNSIYKLDQIQYKFKKNLYDMAVDLDKALRRLESKSGKGSDASRRFFNWYTRQETEGLRDIFDIESYSECNFRSTEK